MGDTTTDTVTKMRAVLQRGFGQTDVLELAEIDKPEPGPEQVLVKVAAASVNPMEWHLMTGKPYIARLQMGLRSPKWDVLGADVAGTVEAVGEDVTDFAPGDRVYGDVSPGTYADYVAAPQHQLARIPDGVSFEQAVAVPVAGLTALQGLRDKGMLQEGQKALIIGASGGVGTYAVQIAKALGAEVTAVNSTRNVEMVRSIGADHVVDYTKEDFAASGERYDVILDMVGNRSLSDIRRAMTKTATYVMVGGPKGSLVGPVPRMLRALVLSRFVSQRFVGMLAHANRADLEYMAELMEAGELVSVIDRRFGLDEVREALRHQGDGHARGKSVLLV